MDLFSSAGPPFHLIDRSEELKEKLVKALPKNQSLEDFSKQNIVGTPTECIKRVQAYKDLGVSYFVFDVTSCIDLKGDLRPFAEEIMGLL